MLFVSPCPAERMSRGMSRGVGACRVDRSVDYQGPSQRDGVGTVNN